jgi:hypothetical protein
MKQIQGPSSDDETVAYLRLHRHKFSVNAKNVARQSLLGVAEAQQKQQTVAFLQTLGARSFVRKNDL